MAEGAGTGGSAAEGAPEILGALREQVGPAAVRLVATVVVAVLVGTVAMTVGVAVLTAELAGASGRVRTLAALAAVVVTGGAWVAGGIALGLVRASGIAAADAIRRAALGRRLGVAAGERLAEMALLAREGTSGAESGRSQGRAAHVVGAALSSLESLPLADAEGYLKRAVDSILGEEIPRRDHTWRFRTLILGRIRRIAVRAVEAFLLAEFRKEATAAGPGGGVDVKKVIGSLAGTVDERVSLLVRAKVQAVTVAIVAALLVVTALPCVLALAYALVAMPA